MGQLLNAEGGVAEEPLYYSHDANLSYYFLKNKMVCSFTQINEENNEESDFRIDMNFLNSNENPEIREGEFKYYKNFYLTHIGMDGLNNVGVYEDVEYADLINGVDVKFKTEGGLKIDFNIQGDTPLEECIFYFDGITSTTIIENGALLIESEGGNLVFENPKCYQLINNERVILDAIYKLDGNNILFEVSGYDPSYPLRIIIGPIPYRGNTTVQTWSTFISGDWGGEHNGMWLDASDQLYTTGKTSSTNFPMMIGQYQISNGQQNAFVYKFNPQRGIVWGSYIGGIAQSATGIKVVANSSGFVYVGGHVYGSIPTCSCTSDPILNNTSGASLFLFKFNSSGFVGPSIPSTFATYYGGGNERLYDMTIDNNDNVYLGGGVHSTAYSQFPLVNLAGGYNQSFIATNNVTEGFISKISASNIVLWSTALGGNSFGNSSGGYNDYVGGMVTDVNNNLYVTGASKGQYSATPFNPPLTIPDPGKFPLVTIGGPCFVRGNSGDHDSYVVKFNPFGAIEWSTLYGGPGTENVDVNDNFFSDIAINSLGNIVITGYTTSISYGANYPTFPHKVTSTDMYDQLNYGGGNNDAYIAMFSANTYELLWSTFYGGSGSDMGKAIAAAPQASLMYLTGFTTSTDFPIKIVNGSYQQTLKGGSDGYLLQFNSNAKRQYSMWYGGSDNCWAELGKDVVTNIDGSQVLFCGKSCSTDFPFKDKQGASDYFYTPPSSPFSIPYAYISNLSNICLPCTRLSNANITSGLVSNPFSIRPNPANQMLHLESIDQKIMSFTIYNTLGQKVKFSNLENHEIFIGDLQQGLYSIRINDSSPIKFFKL